MTARDGKEPTTGLTYAAAGVDIDAGNAMVETIKPLVRSTRRPGADAEIGGAHAERHRHLWNGRGDHGSVEELHEERARHQEGKAANEIEQLFDEVCFHMDAS